MTNKIRFWNKIADKYSRQPIADQDSYELKLEMTRDYLDRQTKVLEIGCGTGSTAIAHAPFSGHIHGLDISDRMIEIASAKLEPAGITNVSFEIGDVDTYSGAPASYDVVMAMSLVHLVKNRAALLSKIYDVLKPGGVLVSSTACLGDNMPYMKPVLAVGHRLGLLPYVGVFKSKKLQADMAQAGFRNVHHWQPARGKAVFLVDRKPV